MSTLAEAALPDAHFTEWHEIIVPASRERVWAALHDFSMSDLRAAKPLFAARAVLARIKNGHAMRDLPAFTTLTEVPREEIVQVTVGQWWRLGKTKSLRVDDWAGFDEPGYAKATFSFRLEGPDGRVRLITETRVKATSPDARRAMGRYWLLIRTGSGLIRRLMLRSIRDLATR
ncbi:hypothetical protein OIE66_30885 [Nonomuraea sp. NBC_01738]|uniref:hypothetical protein n=1 Tax=Nonomuraea sp. NBC_01738 TaxID=2976003 RepID=UPI002E13D336|nr:hypothetical protein OIE66_30885 [Nonomuraea sp. NBC_01738]